MLEKRKGQIAYRFAIFIIGLLVMTLGIVFFIVSDLGATPWDVLHVGLYYRVGLTIGSWSVIMGIFVLTAAAILSKEWPHMGAFLNMLLVGVFIDLLMLLPFIQTPHSFAGKLIMFIAGMIINAYGMGIYISANLGAGPRDSLMLALIERTGWKVRNVRAVIEIIVLLIGWKLGGPANWGTIVYCLAIGVLGGYSIPQCDKLTSIFLKNRMKHQTEKMNSNNEKKRSVGV